MTAAELIAWRKRLGWTKAEAARGLGLTWRQYHRLERGENRVTPTVELLAEAILETVEAVNWREGGKSLKFARQ